MHRIYNILNEDEYLNVPIEKKEGKRKKKKVKTKKLKIKPIIKVKGDYIEAPHPHLLRMPFSLLLIAPKGAGKTTVLHNILTWYYKIFDMVFLFSPTINIDVKWNKLIDKLEIPGENLFSTLKESTVTTLMRTIKDFNNGRENKQKAHCLFIFDDCVELLPKSKKISFLNKLAMNHRHYMISHIIVSQSFKKLDPVVRSNTTGLILFNTDNTAERMKIVEELAANLGRTRFEELWMQCVNIKYGFMYINYDTRKIYQNFETEIGDLDCEPIFLFAKLASQEEKANKYRKKKRPEPTHEPTTEPNT